jgi:competence protein ComEA
MDVPAPRPEPAPPSRAPAIQRALAALIGGAVVWLVVQAALQGSFALRRGAEPGQAPPSRLDLNQATVAELQLLPGVGPKLGQRIDAYRVLYGPYPHVDELRKVPGIGPQLLERIRPHVIVTNERGEESRSAEPASVAAPVAQKPQTRESFYRQPTAPSATPPSATPLLVDVNAATSAELDQLPGIGPKLAQRIIEARTEKPFASIEELRRVPGIGPKTLEKVRPHVVVRP